MTFFRYTLDATIQADSVEEARAHQEDALTLLATDERTGSAVLSLGVDPPREFANPSDGNAAA